MEPIDIGKKNENLYDCYTISRVEAVPSSSGGQMSQIQRKINWVTLNPYGEILQSMGSRSKSKEQSTMKEIVDGSVANHILPNFESFNFETSDMMEEDVMGYEPGLVFFEVRCNVIQHEE